MKIYNFTLSWLLSIFLLSPFLILAFYLLPNFLIINPFYILQDTEFLSSLNFTFTQAFLSTIITVFLAGLGGIGLLSLKKQKTNKQLTFFFLLPNFIPSLFVLLSFFSISSWFSFIFYGLPAIVLLHTMINVGLCSILFSTLFKQKLSGIANLACLEGSKAWAFWWVGIKFLKYEVLILALFFFAFYFTSFSVPLLLGSGLDRSLEVFIYEKILLEGQWAEAMFLSLVQIFVFTGLALCFYFLKKKYNLFSENKLQTSFSSGLCYFSKTWFLLIPFASSAIIVLGFGLIILKNWQVHLSYLSWSLFYYSFLQGFFTGLGVFFLLLLTASLRTNSKFKKFLTFYISPSLVLMGFAYLLLSKNFSASSIKYLFLFAVLSLLFWPIFYRLKLETLLSSLSNQVLLAKSLGASGFLIFKSIVFPQIIKYVSFASGVAALWGSGDFALSLIVLPKDVSLSLNIYSLLSSYRWEQASTHSFFLLILGLSLFYLFNSLVPLMLTYKKK